MFHTFRQNNSGGSFDVDEKAGISQYVIVEGDNVDQITNKAEAIGLYWNGCETGSDCRCCGDRWSEPYGRLDKVPSIYGTPIRVVNGVSKLGKNSYYINWTGDRPAGFIHYRSGRVRAFKLEKPDA